MTTWILLRGLTRESGHWGDFAERLADRLQGQGSVLALDLPGNGILNRQPSPHSVAGMAAACRAEVRRRGLPSPFVLVAMSLGAMVALQWAHDAREQIAGGVLINTSLRGINPFWQRLQPHNYARLFGLLRPGLPAIQREAMVLAMTSSDVRRHADAPALWACLRAQHPVSVRNALRQLLAAARYLPPPHAPAVPLLVLGSQGDRLVSVQCSQRIAAKWNLPLQIHPAAGHDLPLDDPDWVLARLLEWWAPVQGGAARPSIR